MPDSHPHFTSSTETHPVGAPRPSSLPIVSTTPMTTTERETLRGMASGLRALAVLVDDAVAANRVDVGMDACVKVGELGDAGRRAAAAIGSGR